MVQGTLKMTHYSAALAAFVTRFLSTIRRGGRLPIILLSAALLAATVIAPVPLSSQETPPPLRDCRALLKFARNELVRKPETIVEDISGGCRFIHLGLLVDDHVAADVDEMTLLSPDLLATYPKSEVLQSADLTLKGLVFPAGPKLDLKLVYTTDPEERTSTLERLSIDAGGLGRVTLSARLSEFDNTDVDSPLSEQSGVIEDVLFALEDRGIVVDILLPVISGGLFILEDGRAATADTIRNLPEHLISKDSAAAVVRFINALPNPQGKWTLTFQSEEGLPISALAAQSFHELMGRLPGDAHIRATADL